MIYRLSLFRAMKLVTFNASYTSVRSSFSGSNCSRGMPVPDPSLYAAAAFFHRRSSSVVSISMVAVFGLIAAPFSAAQGCNFRGTTKGGVTRLEVPRDPTTKDYNNCVDWISIDTPDEIAERLLQRNQTHFGQAHGTFPTVPPFSEWVDWSASSHTADLILEHETEKVRWTGIGTSKKGEIGLLALLAATPILYSYS